MNEKTCGSPSKTRKRQISHILDTAPTHATEYKKAQKNINAKNTSVVDAYESVDHVVWENG